MLTTIFEAGFDHVKVRRKTSPQARHGAVKVTLSSTKVYSVAVSRQNPPISNVYSVFGPSS